MRKSQRLAISYIPEIKSFGGRNSFARALLETGDDFLEENRTRINRLTEKHKQEFYEYLKDEFSYYTPSPEIYSCILGVVGADDLENAVLLKKDTKFEGGCDIFLNEDFYLAETKIEKIILSNPEKRNFVEVFTGDKFEEFDFSSCFNVVRGDFFIYFAFDGELNYIPESGFVFSADNLDAALFTDKKLSRWFIKYGENTVELSARKISCKEILLKCETIEFDDEEEALIGIEILCPKALCRCNFADASFRFGSKSYLNPDLIIRNGEMREMPFEPFGNPLEALSDFYISSIEAFSKPNAKVVMNFDLTYDIFFEEYEGLNLKERTVKVKKVSFQYFNGERFVMLNESKEYESVFNGETRNKIELSFTVPKNFKKCDIGGVYSFWIRIVLEESGNIYYRPCKMFCPKINNIHISYNSTVLPKTINKTYDEKNDEYFYFYMGFSALPENKLSVFIETEQNKNIPVISGDWEISTDDGFVRIDTIDETEYLAYSGRIVFDYSAAGACDTPQRWLRTKIIKGISEYPTITNIYTNAAQFYLSGNCFVGDEFAFDGILNMPVSAVAITNSQKSKENSFDDIRHRVSNAHLMITENDIGNMLKHKFNVIKEIKCGFINEENLLLVYLKFFGDYFNEYSYHIKKFMMENSVYDIKVMRPQNVFIKVRATIEYSPKNLTVLQELLVEFLDNNERKIGEIPDEDIVSGFFYENEVIVEKLVVSAGIFTNNADGNFQEYIPKDLQGGIYECRAGEIVII